MPGGTVVRCLLGGTWPKADHDLFMVVPRDAPERVGVARQLLVKTVRALIIWTDG